MSERRKRRTQSAADVELSVPIPAPEPSPLSLRQRRRSNARQARIVAYPAALFPGAQMQGMAASQPMFQGMNFQQGSMVYMPPQVVNNSYIFTLAPQQSEIPYCVAIDKIHYPRSTLNASGNVGSLTFSLNQILFPNVNSPVDVSGQVVHGQNFISFCTLGAQSVIFVEIRMDDGKNPDELTQKVIDEFPQSHVVEQDESSTNICPISQTKIDKAGRGVNCKHSQCFDIRNYICKSLETNNWVCPVCGLPLVFEDIRCDKDYMCQNNMFAMSDGEEAGSFLFNDIVDKRFDPYDGTNIFMDRDF